MSERFKKCNWDLIAILRIKLPTQIRLIGKIPLIYKKNLLSNNSDFKIPKIENMITTIFYRNYQQELTNLNMANQGSPAVPHPLRSTHQFNTKKPLLFSTQNSSIQHKKASFQHTPQFHDPLVQQIPHFNTLLRSK